MLYNQDFLRRIRNIGGCDGINPDMGFVNGFKKDFESLAVFATDWLGCNL